MTSQERKMLLECAVTITTDHPDWSIQSCLEEAYIKCAGRESHENMKWMDIKLPPALIKMLDDIKEAKKECEVSLGISESRTNSGLVTIFRKMKTNDRSK